MIAAGLNDSDDSLGRLRALFGRIRPDRVQLNTVIRPPADADVQAVGPERMADIARSISPKAEVIADYQAKHMPSDAARRREEVLATLERRPCTLADIAAGLGMHRNEAIKHLTQLLNKGLIARQRRGEEEYYQAAVRPPRASDHQD